MSGRGGIKALRGGWRGRGSAERPPSMRKTLGAIPVTQRTGEAVALYGQCGSEGLERGDPGTLGSNWVPTHLPGVPRGLP